jgi:sugar lactone lactonase YvrE
VTGSPATTVGSTAPPTTAPPADGTPGPEPAVTFSEVATLQMPVDVAWRDGDDGLYVVEQAGRVVRLTDESMTTVLDITDLTEGGGEQGLLGLAFHPAGELAYVDYTDNDGRTIVAEHPVATDGTFDAEARIVMEIDQPYPNHNGGDVVFGPDGMLYIGMGDGGSGGDPERRATDMSSLLGKMLRIDPTPADGRPYTVPADNPFVDQAGTAPEIWASGLRNPWRFSFDRDTGDLWIADVGQGAIEEIDVAPATAGLDAGKGLSFGWSAFEGDARFNEDVPEAGHTPPFSTYTHGDGRCSVSGGVRARSGAVPELEGWYVYADYCSGQVWALEVIGDGSSLAPGRTVELGRLPSVTAVVDGPGGEVYVVSGGGELARLDPA